MANLDANTEAEGIAAQTEPSFSRVEKFPFVKRNVYHNNCGVLHPLDDFHELLEANVGDDCTAWLHIESEAEMQRLASASSTPKKKAVFQPKLTKPVKDDFLAKLRLHRKRYGW